MIICFQIIMNIVKTTYFHYHLDVCTDLMRISETCDILKNLGIFDVGKHWEIEAVYYKLN